jgi:hypothetical protein
LSDGGGLVVECLCSMCEALSSIPTSKKSLSRLDNPLESWWYWSHTLQTNYLFVTNFWLFGDQEVIIFEAFFNLWWRNCNILKPDTFIYCSYMDILLLFTYIAVSCVGVYVDKQHACVCVCVCVCIVF